MILSHVLEIKPDVVVSSIFQTYHEKCKKNLNFLCSRLQKFSSDRNDLMNGSKIYYYFHVGKLVYMYKTKGTIVHTDSRKMACYFVGSLVMYRATGPNQFLLMSLTGQVCLFLVKESRLKSGAIWTS